MEKYDPEDCTEDGTFTGIDYSAIPVSNLAGGMQRYIEYGITPGHFLTAILCNDFMEAAQRADDTNRRCLFDWAAWLYNHAPPTCFGSKERFAAWTGTQDRPEQPEPL